MSGKRYAVVLALLAVNVSLGDVFYWQGGGSWKAFDDPENWSLSADEYSNPDSRIPGASDTIYTYSSTKPSSTYSDSNVIAKFDMNGGSYSYAGYSNGALSDSTGWGWNQYVVDVRNGTLSLPSFSRAPALNPNSRYIGYKYRVSSDGILDISNTGTFIAGVTYTYDHWYAQNGGTLKVRLDDFRPMVWRLIVEYGGTVVWTPNKFGLSNGSYNGGADKNCSIENNGTLLMPNGFNWNSDPWGSKKYFTVTQKVGTMLLGGSFTKTMVENDSTLWSFTFSFEGGTLVASNSVSFFTDAADKTRCTAIIPASKSVTVQVLDDCSCDMSCFTYGSGATLTKTGPGELRLSSLPPSLNLNAGTVKLMVAATDLSGMTCADGKIVFTQPNNVVNTLSGYANVEFALGGDVFEAGSIVVSSSDATLLSAIATSLNASGTLPDGAKAVIQGDAIKLKVVADHQFESEGELSLSDASGWITDPSAPTGQNVVVSGADTIALADGNLPTFASITVLAGATLKVSASDLALPPIALQNNSKLLVAEGVTLNLTNSLSCAATESLLPVVEFATNTVVNVPDGMKFMNMDLRLRGGLLDVIGAATTQKGVYFGSTEGTETTYFTMSATGGTIRVAGQFLDSGDSNSCGRWFACPAQSGGFVKVVRPITLCGVTMPEAHNGIEIGYLNPQTEAFEVVFDNMVVPVSRRRCRIGGKASVRLVNGAQFKRLGSHPGTSAELAMRQYGSLTLESGSGFIMPRSSTLSGEKGFWMQVNGNNLAVLNLFGGWIAANETGRSATYGTCDLWSSNGTWRVTNYPNIPGDNNPYPPGGDVRNWTTDAFNGFSRVWSNPGTTLYLQSSNDFDGNTTLDRVTKLADIPIRGQGNFVMTNGTPGTAFYATVVHGANTSTGSISVAPSADPTKLFFNDGANWAGTVVAGNIALTNLTDAASPATVKFNALNLAGDFPVRVWKNGNALTNDMVNITASLTGSGKIAPVPSNGVRPNSGDVFVLGTCPASGVDTSDPNAHTVRNWQLLSEDAGGGKVRLLLRYNPVGMVLIFK